MGDKNTTQQQIQSLEGCALLTKQKTNYSTEISKRNKETEWNNQPLSPPILFQNESQKPGEKP
jgi:hypothetical protein